MKNVIITGADGFVGSAAAQYFAEQGVHVLALGRREEPRRLQPGKGLDYLQCDISAPEELLRKVPIGQYDTFLHFAWEGSAGPARFDYELQMQNVRNTAACLKVAKTLGCRRFVGAGSIMEYEVEAAVHGQGCRPGLAYIYGMGKHQAHCLCKTLAADLGIDLVWPMITNAYGVGEKSPRFINTTLRKVIDGEKLQFTSATQNYDFVYISDVARAFYLISQNGRPFCEYMIGSSHAGPLRKFIEELGRAVAPEQELCFGDVPFTGVDLPLAVYDTTATEQDCGFKAEIPFSEGVKMTMNWLRNYSGG